MKSSILMIVNFIMCGVLTLMIAMTMYGRMNRSMEIKSNLSSVVEETVELMANEKYTISNYNEFLADFISNLSKVLDSDSDIIVEVLNADKEKGLLSIRVKEEFKHPNGKKGMVKCDRTVILNKLDEKEVETYLVTFYITDAAGNEQLYKKYQILEGDSILIPTNPSNAHAAFSGWVDGNGYLADFSQPVSQNLKYYAVWN